MSVEMFKTYSLSHRFLSPSLFIPSLGFLRLFPPFLISPSILSSSLTLPLAVPDCSCLPLPLSVICFILSPLHCFPPTVCLQTPFHVIRYSSCFLFWSFIFSILYRYPPISIFYCFKLSTLIFLVVVYLPLSLSPVSLSICLFFLWVQVCLSGLPVTCQPVIVCCFTPLNLTSFLFILLIGFFLPHAV